SPEAAAGGGLALLKTGDRVRIDLGKGTANILIVDSELKARRAALEKQGGYPYPPSQTPWQEIQRGMVDQLAAGMVPQPPGKYRGAAEKFVPRDNHRSATAGRISREPIGRHAVEGIAAGRKTWPDDCRAKSRSSPRRARASGARSRRRSRPKARA